MSSSRRLGQDASKASKPASRPDGALLAELLALHADGTLAVRVARSVPLREASTAYDKVAGGGQRGRWLLLP